MRFSNHARKVALAGVCAIGLGLAGAPALAQDAFDGFFTGGSSGGGYKGGSGERPADRKAREVEVGKGGGFRYSTIADGVKAVGSGGIVRVHPGIYVESLKLTRPVTLVGLVTRPGENSVKIQAPQDAPCVEVDVEGQGFVSIRQIDMQAGSQNVQRSCVELENGYLSIKDSAILGPSYVSTVLARGGHLSLESSSISGGREGILIASGDGNSTYYIVANNITNNITGVRVDRLAQANIVGNRIFANSDDGIVYYQGRGTVIGNDICQNGDAGLVLQDSPQSPTVKANKICQNGGNGIEIVPGVALPTPGGRPVPVSKGVISDNEILNNTGFAIDSKSGSASIGPNKTEGNKGDRSRNRWNRSSDKNDN